MGDPTGGTEVFSGLEGEVGSLGGGGDEGEGGGSAAGHQGGEGALGTEEVLDDGEQGIFSKNRGFEGIKQEGG